ncbi:p115 like vesicle tethering protein [Auriculariales sp. MPI-PUGE-AT-0066]|nr:p115 like vesicle tethering protein [Auriculariales sp. MPI-PUGE-AT-0066]
MEFFQQTYTAIRGPTPLAEVQTAENTITKLVDRLTQASSPADRRASVLALKGIARDHGTEVGATAFPALIATFADALRDAELGKALLETMLVLCDAEPGPRRDVGLRHIDILLSDSTALQSVFALLGDDFFYVRFSALQLLSSLLAHRRQPVQAHFLRFSDASSLIAVLEDRREIIRNEALAVIQVLITQNADIQKIFAFGGAFEKLMGIVTQEGGIEGSIVVQESLTCVETLLRFNVSNLNYFREIGLVSTLCPLFLFPANLPDSHPAPQEFALQFWDTQKGSNAQIVLGVIGMLVHGKAGAGDTSMVRFLVELALASNAPTALKMQALQHLPHHSPLLDLPVTPYVPVAETDGQEWDRMEARTALDVLVDIAVNGEYSGVMFPPLDAYALGLRGAAVTVFENYVRHDEVKLRLLKQAAASSPTGPATVILGGIVVLPVAPVTRYAAARLHIATQVFSSLVRASPQAKNVARTIVPSSLPTSTTTAPGAPIDLSAFFVPADGAPAAAAEPTAVSPSDDEPPPKLLGAVAENLTLAFLARGRTQQEGGDREAREWDRCIVGILALLAQWLWDDPRAVREVLEAGLLTTLVDPIGQDDVDPAVQGLCAFVLGILYEFDREPACEIPRSAIFPLIARLGADTLAARMARLREDERFRSAAPEGSVLAYPRLFAEVQDEGEMWFAWEFVEFWKSNYFPIQRGVHSDPSAARAADAANPEAATLIASLREVIQHQADEIDAMRKSARNQKEEHDTLQKQVRTLQEQGSTQSQSKSEVEVLQKKVEALEEAARSRDEERDALQAQVSSLSKELESVQEKKQEQEKEHEDLLVFLEELSAKRKRDKVALREAGKEVSEDEEEGDDDDIDE